MIDQFVRRFTITKVIDGDTVEGTVDYGFHQKGERVKVRLLDINTPERGQKGYEDATLYLKSLISKDLENTVHLHIPNYSAKTFDRYLGVLYVVDSETQQVTNINQEMLDSGHAVPYLG
jgi:micrococcal nuclease